MSALTSFRFSALRAVFRKEIIDVLRDKRTLAAMILIPLFLYPLLILITSQVTLLVLESREEQVLPVAFAFSMDAGLAQMVLEEADHYKLSVQGVNDAALALDQQHIAAYVTRQPGPVYHIHFKSSEPGSREAANRLGSLLKDYQQRLSRASLEEAGLDPEAVLTPFRYEFQDVTADEERTGLFLGAILPFMLVVGVVTGAIYPAIDVTAGEKERGTMETLLTLPVSNAELMGGKFLAVACMAVAAALLNFLSLALVGNYIAGTLAATAGGESLSFAWGAMALPFAVTLLCIVVFSLFVSAAVLCITSFARSFKEANNYVTPLLLIFSLPPLLAVIPEFELTPVTAAIPAVNIALLIRDVLVSRTCGPETAIVLASNVAYAVLGVILLSRIFNSENILFGQGELRLLERRSLLIKGSSLTPGDGVVLFILGLLALFYLGSAWQLKWGFAGLAATQGLILAMPVLLALYLKADMARVFRWYLPRMRGVAAGVCLWLGALLAALLAGELMMRLFPHSRSVFEGLTRVLKGDNLPLTLAVVALLPAVCEEAFFRGFIFSALRGADKPWSAIAVSSLMFALFHLQPARMPATFILGVALALAAYGTGSLWVPVLMHFLNNAVGVLSLFYPEAYLRVQRVLDTGRPPWNAVLALAAAALLLAAGWILLPRKPGRRRQQAEAD